MRRTPPPQGESCPATSCAAGDEEANMERRDILTRPAPPPDAVLRYGPDRDHVADLRLPAVSEAVPTAAAPLVLSLHGGFLRAPSHPAPTRPPAPAPPSPRSRPRTP